MFLQVDDLDLYVRRIGAGRPILALHGGMGLDHTVFLPWLEPLADSCEIVLYDQRGNGRSSMPADWSSVDDAVWVGDAERLRAQIGLDRPVLFGHSYAVNLALQYALEYGDRLGGLILCAGAAATDHDGLTMEIVTRRATAEQMTALGTLFAPEAGSMEVSRFAATFMQILPLYFHGPVTEAARLTFEHIVYNPRAFQRAYFDCRPRYNLLDRLHETRVPTLILQGRSDFVTPPEPCGVRMGALIPNADLVIFEESGHFPFMEEQAAFCGTIRNWISARVEAGVATQALSGGRR